MGHIYYTRHGETEWNVENKVCGITDAMLTEKGHEQAKALGQKIISEGYKIDMILHSPLTRAKETAGHISQITGIPMRCDERLTEQNYGKWEGADGRGDEFFAAKSRFVNSFDGGESMLRVAQRIYNLLDELKNDSRTYLLVAHNAVSRSVRSYFVDMENEEYPRFDMDNCEILRYEF